jgi:hypothetical protein
VISPTELAMAEYIIDSSDAVTILTEGLRTSPRGRRRDPNKLRLYLLGAYLGVRFFGDASVARAHRTITEDLPLSAQLRLGVRRVNPDGTETVLPIEDMYTITKIISERLGYGVTSYPNLDDDERSRRHNVLYAYDDALVDVFAFAVTSTMYAVDATGIHPWSVARRGPDGDDVPDVDDAATAPKAKAKKSSNATIIPSSEPQRNAARRQLIHRNKFGKVRRGDSATTSGNRPPRSFRRSNKSFDPDARWGYRSARTGERTQFFGYHEHALVCLPGDHHVADDDEPRLIRRFAITPANEDVVDVTLGMIDRLPHLPDGSKPITELDADSLYHHKTVERWRYALVERGIEEHFDLRDDESDFDPYLQMRWAAGSAHCPFTPDRLGPITRPGPTATEEAMDRFAHDIELREQYAMRRHTVPEPDGTHRVMCPALNRTVGCPLRPGTVAAAITSGLPIIEVPANVRNGTTPAPLCCTQKTVKVTPPEPIRKLMQKHYWGSAKWESKYRMRTFIEGAFGNCKNHTRENMRRGLTRHAGLPMQHIVIALINASYNLRILRNWHERGTLTIDHPLLVPDPGPGAWEYLTEAETRAILDRHIEAA